MAWYYGDEKSFITPVALPSLEGWGYRKSHEIVGSTAGAQTNYQIRIKVHRTLGMDSGEDVYLVVYNVETGTWTVDGNAYHRRTKITITENSGSDLTDYQVRVVIDTKWLVYNGYATPNGNEVRFTDSDGSMLLSFWRETDFNQTETVYWVKVPSIPASSTKTIYIYYDEELITVPDASDGEATFEFFDDFLGTTLDATKWTEDAINDITQTINNYFRFEDAAKSNGTYWIYDGTDTGSQHQAKVTLPTDFRVLFTTKISDTATSQMGQGGVAIIATDNTIIVYPSHGDLSGSIFSIRRYVVGENTPTNLGTGWSGDANECWKGVGNLDRAKWEILKSGSLATVNDENGKVCDVSISSTVSKIALTAGAYGGRPYLDYVQVDYVAVAKYVDPEPSVEVDTTVKCRADFGDIRFTKSDGETLLDYWLESYDGGVATFWVKVDSIPASPDTIQIYVYYGNPDATTTSNHDATFKSISDVVSVEYEFECRSTNKGDPKVAFCYYDGSSVVVPSQETIYTDLPTSYIIFSVTKDIDETHKYLHDGVFSSDHTSRTDDARIRMDTATGNTLTDRVWLIAHYSDGSKSPPIKPVFAENYNPVYRVWYERTSEVQESDDVYAGCGTSSPLHLNVLWEVTSGPQLRKYVSPEPSHGAWGSEESNF